MVIPGSDCSIRRGGRCAGSPASAAEPARLPPDHTLYRWSNTTGRCGRSPSPEGRSGVDIIAGVEIRAVFFDAGETLVHPHPSFPELLTQVLNEEGHDVDADLVRERLWVVSERFLKAAQEN